MSHLYDTLSIVFDWLLDVNGALERLQLLILDGQHAFHLDLIAGKFIKYLLLFFGLYLPETLSQLLIVRHLVTFIRTLSLYLERTQLITSF